MKANLTIQLKHALCNDTSHIKINYFIKPILSETCMTTGMDGH